MARAPVYRFIPALVLLLSAAAASAEPRQGVLIVAHGAPSPAWNTQVMALRQQVAERFDAQRSDVVVRLAFMEFASPSVADGVRELEQAGCVRIVAVPLLIAPSSHAYWDVPTLLGLHHDAQTLATLHDEGAQIAQPTVPVTITATLDRSDVLERVLLRRVQALSTDPANEAVVVLAHGSSILDPYWNDVLRRLVTYACGNTGITYGDWAFAHVGQTYTEHAVPAIKRAAASRRRVIVVGCYVSMSVAKMHQRAGSEASEALGDVDVIFADEGLLPDEAIAQWAVDQAAAAMPAPPPAE